MRNLKREFERYAAITKLCGRIPISFPEWLFEQRYRRPRPRSVVAWLSDRFVVRETA